MIIAALSRNRFSIVDWNFGFPRHMGGAIASLAKMLFNMSHVSQKPKFQASMTKLARNTKDISVYKLEQHTASKACSNP